MVYSSHQNSPRLDKISMFKCKETCRNTLTSGKVDIDLSIMGIIKIKKQLDLCNVLRSDILGNKDCRLQAGDVNLDATAWIPKELPKLPLDGDIRISDQDGKTFTFRIT
ncbi:hypothetical protein [Parasitella parasitica]|uniref:MD-2-related lipid-recognition domain-containing protein n=1 Tax=Parasitella parasitica TaxID=35722 RepID=A0A0B7NKM0_9FUNG|nr:hypothetical protein [Parasitella parasitica]